MATARDIVTRALKQLGVSSSVGDVSAEDAADALAALNDMMHGWKVHHVDVLHSDYTLASTVNFFVPPDEGKSEYFEPLYQGTWDASTNSPTLATGTGTEGYVYKVSTSGSTTLDDVASWTTGDWLAFDGVEWVKCRSSRVLEDSLAALLAVRMAPYFGKQPHPVLQGAADAGWKAVQSMCQRVPPAEFEPMIVSGFYSRRVGFGS